MKKYGKSKECTSKYSHCDVDLFFSVERFQNRLIATKNICIGSSITDCTRPNSYYDNRKQTRQNLIPEYPYPSYRKINGVPPKIAIEHSYHSTRTLEYCNMKESTAWNSLSSIISEDDGTRKEIEHLNSIVDLIMQDMTKASRADWVKSLNHQISISSLFSSSLTEKTSTSCDCK